MTTHSLDGPTPVQRHRPAVPRPAWTGVLRQWRALAGAGSLIAVGYMDPGNWATALQGGARYGYALLTVVIVASLMAMVLQHLAARVGWIARQDLAQLTRQRYGRGTALGLGLACEVAIVACDMAEIVGSAVAFNLLFGWSLPWGVAASALTAVALLLLRSQHRSRLERLVGGTMLAVLLALVIQVLQAQPHWAHVVQGAALPWSTVRQAGFLWLAAGIVGATIMPHNLYLHSALARDRALERTAQRPDEQAQALRAMAWDSAASLSLAAVANAALLMLAAAAFHAHGITQVQSLADAHRLLTPLLGTWSGTLFATALLACGVNATFTGTLAGQVTAEGFWNWRMAPWQRALLTRSLAMVPAMAAVLYGGDGGTTSVLVASQVVLSVQLPFALVPLLRAARDPRVMGPATLGPRTSVLVWSITLVLVALNLALLGQAVTGG